jgi:hypothetical protein
MAHSFELVLINRISNTLMWHRSQIDSILNGFFEVNIISKVRLYILIQHSSLELFIVYIRHWLIVVFCALHGFVLVWRLSQCKVRSG